MEFLDQNEQNITVGLIYSHSKCKNLNGLNEYVQEISKLFNIFHTLSFCIGKVVASHAAVAHLILLRLH